MYEETVAGPFKNVKDARKRAMSLIRANEDYESLTLSQVKSHYDEQYFWGDMTIGVKDRDMKPLVFEGSKCFRIPDGRHRMNTYRVDKNGNLTGNPIRSVLVRD